MRIILKFFKHKFTKVPNFTKYNRQFSYTSNNSNGLSYYHNHGQKPLRSITIGEVLDDGANSWPDRRAVVSMHEDITQTFSELREQANQLGASLLKLGLKRGDRIAVLGPNTVHWNVTMFAAVKAGLILVTVNPAYRTNELKYCLKKVGVKALIMDEMFKTQNYYDMLLEIDPNIANLPVGYKIKSSQLPELEYIIVKTNKQLPGTSRYCDIMQIADNERDLYEMAKKIQPDDPVFIQYSSGTTGNPKAATLTHFGVVNNSNCFGTRIGMDKMHHTLLLQVPLFHVFGSILGAICSIQFGITTVFPGPSFKVETSLTAMKKEKLTVIYGTPTMYSDLIVGIKNGLNMPGNEALQSSLSNFKVILSGGAVCNPTLFTEIAKTFKCDNINSAYGMSELSPVVFNTTPEDTLLQRTSTVGRLADHCEVKIVDSDGRMLPFGSPGEAWFRGYTTMLNYWGDEEKTKETITNCQWLKSGDLMVLTPDGYGKIVGRIKDIIIRGGENIFPSEIEHFLQQHQDIVEAYVYGISDERMGEEVCASIKLISGSTLDEHSVKEYCKGKIAHFKIPRYIQFVDDFPKTASGKIKKYVLREMMEEEQQQSRNSIKK